MLVPDPETPGVERIKILDFGIAKLSLDAASGEAPEDGEPGSGMQPEFRTRTGAMMGTPAYMAPEQCRGAEQVTDRTDVYSFGLMMYRAISGSAALVGRSDLEYLLLHTTVQPPDLHEKFLIDAELSALVHSMLAKEPTQRPAMAEIAPRLGQLAARLSAQGSAGESAAEISAIGSAPTALGGLPGKGVSSTLNNARTVPPQSSELLPKESSTTLGAATGDRPDLGSSLPRRLVVGGGALAGVVLATLVGIFHHRHTAEQAAPPKTEPGAADVSIPADKPGAGPATASPAAPAVAARVHWEVSTNPPGALVLSAESNDVLGVTPWRHDRDAAQGPFKVLLRLPNYQETPVTLDRGRDSVVQLMLSRQPDSAPHPVRTPGRGKGTKPQTPSSGKSLTNADLPVVE